MAKRTDPHRKQKAAHHAMRKCLICQLKTTLVFAVLFLTGCYIAFLTGCRPAQSFYYSIGALAAAALISGMLAGKNAEKRGVITALHTTAFSICIVFLAALISTQFHPDLRLFISAAIMLLCAALGGMIGVNLHQKPSSVHLKKGRRK